MSKTKLTVPETHRDLLEQPIVVTLGTVAPDGQPFAAVVWRRWDGEFVRIVSDRGNRKMHNIETNPRVSVTAIDPKNPYRFLGLTGVVEAIITDRDESLAELNLHNLLYMGKDKYYATAEEEANHTSVVLKIRPTRFIPFPKPESA